MIENFELTQSSLKDFNNLSREEWSSKWIYKTKPYEYSTAFIYGSLLDGFLFDQESLVKRFKTYDGTCKPSDAIQGIVGLMAKNYNKSKSIDQQLLEASKQLNYGNKWKDKTIIARFDEHADYIDFCIQNRYKTVVLKQFAKDIQNVARYLISHEPNEIRKYIVKEPDEDYRNEFQRTLRGNILGLNCKVILDILHYDEINSTIRDIDFKTTSNTATFEESIIKYGYDTQVSFYQEILHQNAELFKNYTLIEPINVVVSKRDLDILVHPYTEIDLMLSKNNWINTVQQIANYLEELKYDKK